MKDTFVTITSKNQITLPAAIVRKMKLEKTRRLRITEKKGKLELTPEPSLQERLEKFWKTLPPFEGTKTEEELKRAIQESVVIAWEKKEAEGRHGGR